MLQKCIDCGKEFPVNEARYECECSGLLEIVQDLKSAKKAVSKKLFESRMGSRQYPYGSGVWRYKELIHPLIPDEKIVSIWEGNTGIHFGEPLREYVGLKEFFVKVQGENPTGSFKDNGMTVAISQANFLGLRKVACASTGNTSASMAAYCAIEKMNGIVFVPKGNIAMGKLSQALAYGVKTLQVEGNFDEALKFVGANSLKLGMYLVNSINPFRIEGQKSIAFEMAQQMDWKAPDWVIMPGGNLGNASAIGKGFRELKEIGFIEKIPRIAVVQSKGANPFYRLWKERLDSLIPVDDPHTIASAVKIGNPVSWKKALREVQASKGVVEEVSDQEIMDAKAVVDSTGIGCEPASACSVAGAKKLVDNGIIKSHEKVVGLLTGNILKDPDATINYHLNKLEGIIPKFQNRPVEVRLDFGQIKRAIEG